jgi:hypothetical protein
METDVVNNEIMAGLDAVLPMERAQKDILEKIDSIIQKSVEDGDPDIAGNALKSLLGVSRIAGLALAKFLYTFKFQWKNFNRTETFEAYVDDFVGRKPVTLKRYIRVWEMFVSGDIPREYSEKLKLHPIRSLVPMAALHAQGYDIPSEKWMKLSNAPDVATVNKICREIKGLPPKKNSLQIEMDTDGSIYAWSNNKRYYVGYFKVDDENEIVQKAIARLISDKVMEK